MSARYKACVVRYLASSLGRTATDDIAAKLMGLDPLALGMPAEPSNARLHATRAFFEVWKMEDQEQAAAEARHAS
jgi:hypothetical protein